MDELARTKAGVERDRTARRPKPRRLSRVIQTPVSIRYASAKIEMALLSHSTRSETRVFWSAAFHIAKSFQAMESDSMKSTTIVHAAIRNIGDSQDTGKFFEGQLSDSIFWLAAEMAQMRMATRLVIGIGRSKDDAARGIEVKGAGTTKITDDMKSKLAALFDDSQDEDHSPAQASGVAQRVEGDDYVEPTQ